MRHAPVRSRESVASGAYTPALVMAPRKSIARRRSPRGPSISAPSTSPAVLRLDERLLLAVEERDLDRRRDAGIREQVAARAGDARGVDDVLEQADDAVRLHLELVRGIRVVLRLVDLARLPPRPTGSTSVVGRRSSTSLPDGSFCDAIATRSASIAAAPIAAPVVGWRLSRGRASVRRSSSGRGPRSARAARRRRPRSRAPRRDRTSSRAYERVHVVVDDHLAARC
jgi:hypothetical protein